MSQHNLAMFTLVVLFAALSGACLDGNSPVTRPSGQDGGTNDDDSVDTWMQDTGEENTRDTGVDNDNNTQDTGAPDTSSAECTTGSDCPSGVCRQGTCVPPTCNDQVQNGEETGVDCGGTKCDPCSKGRPCKVPSDCKSGVCDNGTCAAATCTDNEKNGDETDVDCGGSSCPACQTGETCKQNSDCKSNLCDNQTCINSTCTDNMKNGQETDVDCGGPNCAGCKRGKSCSKDSDCKSKNCTSGGTCGRGNYFKFSQGYRISDSCVDGGGSQSCSMTLNCKSDDVIWQWVGRHTNGDHDAGEDDFHANPSGDCSNTIPDPTMKRGKLTVNASSCGGDQDTYRAWAYCVPRGPAFDYGSAYKKSKTCTANRGICTMALRCNGSDVAWLSQQRRIKGDDDHSKDEFHNNVAKSGADPSFTPNSVTMRPSSAGTDTDDYRGWLMCVPRGGGFDFSNAYTVSGSCTVRNSGSCALKASCNGDDKLWNYQARKLSGDHDNSKDDLHGDIASSSPPPQFSGSSITLQPSSPGGDKDSYKIWALCVPKN